MFGILVPSGDQTPLPSNGGMQDGLMGWKLQAVDSFKTLAFACDGSVISHYKLKWTMDDTIA